MTRDGSRPALGAWLIAVVSGALLFAPAIAYVVGHTDEPVENKPRAAFPGRDSGWAWVTELSRAVNDRLPLRSSAVRADGWIDEHVFEEDPAYGGAVTPEVIRGIDGYLFLNEDFQLACLTDASPEQAVAAFAAVAAALEASGRTTVVGIAPNKSSVLSDMLPLNPPGERCHDEFTDRLWAAVEAATIPQYVDVLAALEAQRAETGRPLYHRLDTHWNLEGALVATRMIIDRLDPGLWTESEVLRAGEVEQVGDLSVMQGNPRSESVPAIRISRPDVVPVSEPGTTSDRRFLNSAPAGRLIPGRTVIVLDSFGLAQLPLLVPYFEDLTVVEFDDLSGQQFIPYLTQADNVILLTVERFLERRMTEHFDAAFLAALTQALES